MQLDRRVFTGSLSALACALALKNPTSFGAAPAGKPLFVATWNFGLPACEQSLKTLQTGGSVLDASNKASA